MMCWAIWDSNGVKREFAIVCSNRGEKSINFYFIMVPLRKKSIKVWYSKAQTHQNNPSLRLWRLGRRRALRLRLDGRRQDFRV